MFEKLQAHAQVDLETLEQPIRIVQVDGSTILVNRIANVDTVLETEAGPYDLGQVAFRVLPGEVGELIIGKTDMNRMGITTPEVALADVISGGNTDH